MGKESSVSLSLGASGWRRAAEKGDSPGKDIQFEEENSHWLIKGVRTNHQSWRTGQQARDMMGETMVKRQLGFEQGLELYGVLVEETR